jgi:hypothetical protein
MWDSAIIRKEEARGALQGPLEGATLAALDAFFADPLSLFKGGAFVAGGR